MKKITLFALVFLITVTGLAGNFTGSFGTLYTSNKFGWMYQETNGLTISSNINSTCTIIDTNRNFLFKSNNVVLYAMTNGNLYVSGALTVDELDLLNSYSTNLHAVSVSWNTNGWRWSGPTNSIDWALGSRQIYQPSGSTFFSITNFINFPTNEVGDVVLEIYNTNATAITGYVGSGIGFPTGLTSVVITSSNELDWLCSQRPKAVGPKRITWGSPTQIP